MKTYQGVILAFDPLLHPRMRADNRRNKRWCERALKDYYSDNGLECAAVPIMYPVEEEEGEEEEEEEGNEAGEKDKAEEE